MYFRGIRKATDTISGLPGYPSIWRRKRAMNLRNFAVVTCAPVFYESQENLDSHFFVLRLYLKYHRQDHRLALSFLKEECAEFVPQLAADFAPVLALFRHFFL